MVKLIGLPGALLAFPRIEAGCGQVNVPDLFLKAEPGPGRLGQVNHAAVEHPPGNRPDRLPLLPVLLVVHGLAHHVHGALVKGDPDLANLVFDPDLAQGLPAPVAHGQVDGTAREFHVADVGPAVENSDFVPGLSQVDGQEGTYQARPDDGHPLWALLHGNHIG